jgi:hypothetical protein
MKQLCLLAVILLPSTNIQAQWQPDVRLTFDTLFSSTSFSNARSIEATAGKVYSVWSDARDGNREIYCKISPDDGVSWENDIRLTNNGAGSIFPSITVAGSVVHVVWEEYRDGNGEIYYKRSPDAGVSWGAHTRLTNNPANSFSPSVAVSGMDVHLTWFDQRDGNDEIYYKRSGDGGLNWGADTRLTNDPFASVFPSIAVSDSVVHVVWEEHRDGNGEMYYKRSSDGGITWGTDTRLTTDAAQSFSPSIAASGSAAHIAWFDRRNGNFEIYHKHSGDGGLSWGVDTRVTVNAAVSNYPSVSVSGSHVHLVWFDERDGNTEIYYNHSTDRGVTWGADIRLTNNAARSTDPCVAVSGAVVHVVWTDARDNGPGYNGNYEIYYKRNPSGNPVQVSAQDTNIPDDYVLSQNYPNPFNPNTVISFSLPQSEVVTLSVFNILGEETALLVAGRLAAGTHRVEWRPQDVPSGVYLYRIQAGSFVQTRKLAFIK